MNLTWSHAVMYVRDLEGMLNFYTDRLGFQITDRGPLAENAPDIVFLSQDPDEHHQIAMVPSRKDEAPSNSVNHFAFRTDSFDKMKNLHTNLQQVDGIKINPLSHGNTLSMYINDPERNGVEVFWDTPWHVAQPQGKPWNADLDEAAALAWVHAEFGHEPTFVPREQFYTARPGF